MVMLCGGIVLANDIVLLTLAKTSKFKEENK